MCLFILTGSSYAVALERYNESKEMGENPRFLRPLSQSKNLRDTVCLAIPK